MGIKKIIGDLEHDISKERMDFQALCDRQDKAVKAIDRSCKQVLDELRGGQKNWSQGIRDQIDDRFNMLQAAIAKSRLAFNGKGVYGSSKMVVGDTLNELSKLLEQEKLKTKEGAEKIDSQISGELSGIETKILAYKQSREDCQNKYKQMMAETNTRLMSAIEVETTERKETNASLLNVLEDAC